MPLARKARHSTPFRPLSISLGRFASALACCAAIAAGIGNAGAATYYWDNDAVALGNNAATGAGLGGAGTWDTTATKWWNITDVAWPNLTTDTAIFTGTAGTVTLGTAINVNTLSFVSNGYTIAGNTLTLAGTTPTIQVAAGQTATISSVLAGSAGLVKSGTGTLSLSGLNLYTGTTTISAGILQANSATALGTVATGGPITFGGGTLQYGGASAAATDWGVRIKSSGSAVMLDTNGQNVTFGITGIIDVSNTGGLTKLGLGTLTLSGADAYLGTTTINGGILQADNVSALGAPAGNITFGGGTLQYSALSAGTNWGARIKNSTSAVVLDTNGVNVTFGTTGIIDVSNTGGLTKVGLGTLTLSGADAYLGTTTINGGILQANNVSALSAGNISFGGGTLQYSAASAGTDWGSRFKNSPSFVVLDTNTQTVTIASVIDASNLGLTKTGAGTLNVSGANTYTGGTTVNGGTLTASGASALGSTAGVLTVSNPNAGPTSVGNAVILNLSTTASTITGSLSGTIATPNSGTNTVTINNGGQLFTVNQTSLGTFAGVIAGNGG